MEGREEVTIEGNARLKRAPEPSQEARRTGAERVGTGANDQTGTLRGVLIAAAAGVLVERSDPRLCRTRDTHTAA
jgi:hypothetical protein